MKQRDGTYKFIKNEITRRDFQNIKSSLLNGQQEWIIFIKDNFCFETGTKIILNIKVAHCQIDKTLDGCWFIPNVKGNLQDGIHQSEVSFDYERFTPTLPSKPFSESESSGQDSFLLDFDWYSIGNSDAYNNTSSRKRRYSGNINKYSRISDIKTICPYATKKSYESNGLSCNDLRKINTSPFHDQEFTSIHLHTTFIKQS